MSELQATLTLTGTLSAVLAAFAAVKTDTTPTVTVDSPAPALAHGEDEPLNTTAPSLDARGFPWDDRIHSKNKSLNKDGSWRYARGVEQSYITAVEAEIKPQLSAPIPVAAPVSAPFPAATVQPVTVAASVTNEPVIDNFGSFMQHLGAKTAEKMLDGSPKISAEYLQKIAGEVGLGFGVTLNGITDVSANPDMIRYAVQLIQRDGRW